MRESSLVPTNLLNWPRVATLLPELKLIVLALWSAPYLSCSGCGLVPLRPFASSLGLSPEALATGLELLQDAGLIACDQATGEIFVTDWFRFHKFPTPKSFGMLLTSIAKIESQPLRDLVKSRLPAAPAYISKTAPAVRGDEVDETGVLVRTAEDRQQLDALCKTHGAKKIKSIVDQVRGSGERPFISQIVNEIRSSRPAAGSDRARGLSGDPSLEIGKPAKEYA